MTQELRLIKNTQRIEEVQLATRARIGRARAREAHSRTQDMRPTCGLTSHLSTRLNALLACYFDLMHCALGMFLRIAISLNSRFRYVRKSTRITDVRSVNVL